MNKLVPGKKKFTLRNTNREIIANWVSPELDWKANVVCEPCNTHWMSNIESMHAKPSMAELITGKLDIPIDQTRADSIALFAFKTAVVFDHISRDREPFFERSVRHEFRNSLTIPINVGMWLTGFAPTGRGEAITTYHEGGLSPDNRLEVYVCTYAVEHLVIQIVSYRQRGLSRISVKDNFLAVPFWPKIPNGFVWPPTSVLQSANDFDSFSARWQNVMATF